MKSYHFTFISALFLLFLMTGDLYGQTETIIINSDSLERDTIITSDKEIITTEPAIINSIGEVITPTYPLDAASLFSSTIPYEWISYKMKMIVELDNNNYNIQLFFVNKIDSIIYLNAHIGGIELGRMVITPEELVFVNKLQKKYYQGDMEFLKTMIGIQLDFYMVQAILNAVDFVGFEETFDLIDHESSVQLVASNRCHQTKELCIHHDVLLNNSFQMVENNIAINLIGQSLEVSYSQYITIDSLEFFSNLKIGVPGFGIKGEADLKNLKINAPGPTSISIPNSFSLINLSKED